MAIARGVASLQAMIGAALIALALLRPARADDLVAGVEAIDQYPIYDGRSGNYLGFARELLDGFAKANGHTVHYKTLANPDLYNAFLRQGTVDLKFPDNPSWQPEQRATAKIAYSTQVLRVVEGVSVLSADLGKGLDHLKRLGGMRGFTPLPYVESIQRGVVTFTQADDFAALVELCATHQIDGIYANTTVINFHLVARRQQPDLLKFDDSLPFLSMGFHLSSISRPDIVQQFDMYLVKDKTSIAQLKLKYHIYD